MNRQKIEEEKLFIADGEHLSFKSGEFRIRCGKGLIWVTWPWSGDVILRESDQIYIIADGTLCLKAFTGSVVYIKKGRLPFLTGNIPGLIVRKTLTAILSIIKNGRNNSDLGDSVNSIIR
jgi:hypothetical protein